MSIRFWTLSWNLRDFITKVLLNEYWFSYIIKLLFWSPFYWVLTSIILEKLMYGPSVFHLVSCFVISQQLAPKAHIFQLLIQHVSFFQICNSRYSSVLCFYHIELGPMLRALCVTFITIRTGDLSLDIVISSINQFYMTFC